MKTISLRQHNISGKLNPLLLLHVPMYAKLWLSVSSISDIGYMVLPTHKRHKFNLNITVTFPLNNK
jgi:hypothetical protein